MKKDKGSSKAPKVDKELTDKTAKAQGKLEKYMKDNKLDPKKDYSKDKKHGKAIAELKAIIDTSRKKVADAAPKEIHHKKGEDKAKPKKAKAESGKYDYPLIDGREMTSSEKKKYRVKMRGTEKKANKPEKIEKVEKAGKVEKTSKKVKETKPEVKVEKKSDKKDKKKKKKVRQDD